MRSRWEHGERSRAELLAALDEGEADYASGQVSRYTTDTLPTLAADLKREARTSRKPS